MDPTAIQTSVEAFADFLLQYFVALAAVGALAMALIELWKKLTDSRTRFHSRAVCRWINSAPEAFVGPPKLPADDMGKASAQGAYRELIHLTTGSGLPAESDRIGGLLTRDGEMAGFWRFERHAEHALYALELGQMMGHLQDAAEIALNNPTRYPGLYLFMVHGARREDVQDWYEQADSPPQVADRTSRPEAKARADLYARLRQVVKRKLDAFQLFQGDIWVNRNQLAANLLGALVLFATLCWVHYGPGSPTPPRAGDLVLYIVISLLGGMLAPIAKDLVVALRKVRQGG
jgi:hypothetical protein